jgi:hypothetical protein
VIIVADTPDWKAIAKNVLHKEAGVRATPDLQAILWINDFNHQIEWVVGYDGFIGKLCQMHVVKCSDKPAPRKMLWVAFDYPFNQAGMKAVLGVVNSTNESAMRFNKHLGFKEMSRLPDMHDDGGDLILFKMDKSECKWLKEKKYEAELVSS